MKENVIVWKESVYKNGFRCKCGNVLIKDQTLSEENTYGGFNGFRKMVYCKKCNAPVAYMKYMEVPEGSKIIIGDLRSNEKMVN